MAAGVRSFNIDVLDFIVVAVFARTFCLATTSYQRIRNAGHESNESNEVCGKSAAEGAEADEGVDNYGVAVRKPLRTKTNRAAYTYITLNERYAFVRKTFRTETAKER